MSNKTHAKEYLIEFSKEKPDWLKVLVKEAIATNGVISAERKNAIFDCCLKGTQIGSEIVQSEYIPPKSEKLLLESLTHTSGVNALSENQTIQFSPDVTILYGLNGSGKSSYFKILNNVSVNTTKDIYPNIYDTNKKPINISIGYKLGNTSKTHDCTGSINLQSDFHGVKVFDSSYLNGLLQPKNPDETLVFPLGLHLFGYIAQIMDEYSKKITQCIEYEKSHLPIIRTESFNGSINDKFDRHEKFTADEKKQIKANFVFTDDEKQVLIQSEKELNELRQINYEDKIKLLTKENNTLSDFITKINDITKKLNEYEDELRKAFAACTIAKVKNDEARIQSEIITKLPKSDTNEWKTFIKAGHEYSAMLEKNTPARCPYCNQELKTDDAIKILKAYSDFLSDTSETELRSAEQHLIAVQKKIENLETTIVLPNEIETIVDNIEELRDKINQFSSCKNMLQLAVKEVDIRNFEFDFTRETRLIEIRKTKNTKSLTRLNLSNKDKDNKISELKNTISKYKEKQSISEQKEDIEKYFSIYEQVQSYEKKNKDTNTRAITILANQAQNELLTTTLSEKFKNELSHLRRNHLEVRLEVNKGTKGKCQTQLKLVGNHSVKDILSEGEQKAVGLAMFFAEIQGDNLPIILDDPVTSLDHEIAGMLAKRLLDFSNQVIVFCHNKLFLDGFETSKDNHICKDFNSCCNTKGKHIRIYQIYGDGKEKGILSNYKGDNSKSLINRANKLLQKKPFSENNEVAILLRRAVEKIIDEYVFKNQLPPRVSNKNSRINWDELKHINEKPNLIEKLRDAHNDLSEEDHVGTASIENPASIDKLRDLSKTLSNIIVEFGKTDNPDYSEILEDISTSK